MTRPVVSQAQHGTRSARNILKPGSYNRAPGQDGQCKISWFLRELVIAHKLDIYAKVCSACIGRKPSNREHVSQRALAGSFMANVFTIELVGFLPGTYKIFDRTDRCRL